MSMMQPFRTDPVRPAPPASPADAPLNRLARTIEGSIRERASGRIRDLHVEFVDDLIVLEGRARTQHAKQLAQEAALDVADARWALANRIVVR